MKESSNTVYSRTCLVGHLNAKSGLTSAVLEKRPDVWSRHQLSDGEFESLNRTYYTAHIISMAETGVKGIEEKRPESLKGVKRYSLSLKRTEKLMLLRKYDVSLGKVVALLDPYPATIKDVSVWFFSCDVILFSIEIDDSGVSLNDLTMMHGQWKNWTASYHYFGTAELGKTLEPLTSLTAEETPDHLTFQNTKMRQYQVVQVNESVVRDNLLYELASHSPVGVVADNNPTRSFKPADDYFNKIIEDNTVSVFSDWKALALNDTFTVLAIDEKYQESEQDSSGGGYRFFEMLYMRCLVQEYYCFSQNNAYRDRLQMKRPNEMVKEIEMMERYYFYDDLSYDFLPPLIYNAMVKGLGLESDRRELIGRVKQALGVEKKKADDKRQSRNNQVVATVKIFAVASVVWTAREMVKKIIPSLDDKLWYNVSVFAIAIILTVILLCITRNPHKDGK
mgnify:CR=1 FL=1